MNTNILKHGTAYQLVKPTAKDAQFIELMAALTALGHSSALVGSNEHGAHCVAIELPCGLPLYINFQYRTYSERAKGFLHFFTFTGVHNGSDKVIKAKEALQLDEPNRFTLKTITAKKLQAVIEYWDKIGAQAMALENEASALLNEWRAKLADCPYEWRGYSHKENSSAAINGSIYSEKFEYALSLNINYPYPSESVKFRGENTLKEFLIVSDALSADKQWFNVDFTGGLEDCVALHLCHGTKYAVGLWAAKNESVVGAIGHISTPLKVPPRGSNRQVNIVNLGELL